MERLGRGPRVVSVGGTGRVVLDASAIVDVLVHNERTAAVREAVGSAEQHVPSHFDTEVLSALGRMHRAGLLTDGEVRLRLGVLARSSMTRHPLASLLPGAWVRRHRLQLPDALYAELAFSLDAPLITCDAGLAAQVPGSVLVG